MLVQGPATREELLAPAVLEALGKAKEAGKIRFCGFSSHKNQAEMLREAVKSRFYDVAMISYNHAGHYTHSVSKNYYEWDQEELEREIEKAAEAGVGLVAMKTCSAGPLREHGELEATYTAALRRVLRNEHIGTIVPAMANFREIEEDVSAMA